MPLALIMIGTVLLIASVRGTTDKLFSLLRGDFTGEGNFLLWILALGAVGAVGYVKPLKPVANSFLVLIVIIFLLVANKGGRDFFSSLLSQIQHRPVNLGASSSGPEKDGFFEGFTDDSKATTKTVTTIAKLFGL